MSNNPQTATVRDGRSARRARLRAGGRAGAVATAVVLGAGGCIGSDVASSGVTGVSVTAGGEPVILLARCAGTVDGVDVFGAHQGDDTTRQSPIGAWRSAPPAGAVVELDASSAAPAGWTVVTALPPLEDGVAYGAFGYSDDKSWQSRQVDFTLEDLGRLTPERVLSARGSGNVDQFYDDSCGG